jgi:hypothetical protein
MINPGADRREPHRGPVRLHQAEHLTALEPQLLRSRLGHLPSLIQIVTGKLLSGRIGLAPDCRL